MTGIGRKLKTVLEGYAAFLRKRELVLPGHQQHLVRWVREFLLFAEEHGGYTFEQTLDLFLAAVGERVGTGVPIRIRNPSATLVKPTGRGSPVHAL